MFVATNDVYSFLTKEEATGACLAMNRECVDHPTFWLYFCSGNGAAEYLGRLWRPFGQDFGPDPWSAS